MFDWLRRLIRNKRGISPIGIVTFILAIFVAGVLLPTAMNGFQAANYTNNDATVKIVAYIMLPVIALVGLGLKFLKAGKGD